MSSSPWSFSSDGRASVICFSEVIAEGLDTEIDLALALGQSAAIVTSRQSEIDAIIRLILGFLHPSQGEFSIYDQQPAFLRDSEISLLRKNIGVIYHDGGLLSNLNLWENLTLQLAFDAVLGRKEISELATTALSRVGYIGQTTESVSRLSLFQRRQVAFARAFMAKPALMIYHSTFEGLSRIEQKQLSSLAKDYHGEGDVTSIFLSSYPESLHGMNFDYTYYTGGTSQP